MRVSYILLKKFKKIVLFLILPDDDLLRSQHVGAPLSIFIVF